MERLTKLENGIFISKEKWEIDKILEKLGEYEELEENGLLLRLPCKEFTTIYEITDECNSLCCCDKRKCDKCAYYNLHIVSRILSLSQIVLHLKDFGETIFLDEEGAKARLEKMKKK